MGKVSSIKNVDVSKLIPYINNAKQHSEDQITRIASSIREFGFLSPVLIDHEYNIIAGHGRVLAAKKLGLNDVPCVYVEGLSDAQRKAYILADNRLGELADWDMELVTSELELLQESGFDFDLVGFELDDVADDWFSRHEKDDASRQEGNEEYNQFLDKFEQPKTTDDCYTPDGVYDAVANYVTEKYGYKREQMVRPFYPGGDYQSEKYPEGCCVVDNPPFSILSEIRKWYTDRGIKYFLFAPMASCIGGNSVDDCSITIGVAVTYENKAVVPTSFVTNLEQDYLIITEPKLRAAIQTAADEYAERFRNPMPKYTYPSCVITAAMGAYLSKYGQDFKLKKESACLIRELDMQKEQGKAIFGGGYLLSEKAAAEKAAAEKAAAEKAAAEKAAATVWLLSDREKEIQSGLK